MENRIEIKEDVIINNKILLEKGDVIEVLEESSEKIRIRKNGKITQVKAEVTDWINRDGDQESSARYNGKNYTIVDRDSDGPIFELDETIQEKMEVVKIVVEVRDARRANEIIDDDTLWSKKVRKSGSNAFYIPNEEMASDILSMFDNNNIGVDKLEGMVWER